MWSSASPFKFWAQVSESSLSLEVCRHMSSAPTCVANIHRHMLTICTHVPPPAFPRPSTRHSPPLCTLGSAPPDRRPRLSPPHMRHPFQHTRSRCPPSPAGLPPLLREGHARCHGLVSHAHRAPRARSWCGRARSPASFSFLRVHSAQWVPMFWTGIHGGHVRAASTRHWPAHLASARRP